MNRTFRCVFVMAIAAAELLLPRSGHALRPAREYQATPADYGIIAETVSFRTSDGMLISGWFFPAQDTAGMANAIVGRLVPVPERFRKAPRPYATADSVRRGPVVICDGDAGNMTQFILYAYHLCTRGLNVLTFDWRGYGGSQAWPIDADRLCHAEFLRDYDAAIDYVKTRREVAADRIGVFGISTGALLSFAIEAKRSDVTAYAGRGLLTTFDEVMPGLRSARSSSSISARAGNNAARRPARTSRRNIGCTGEQGRSGSNVKATTRASCRA